MKKRLNNSARATALQVILAIAFLATAAILFASTFRGAPSVKQDGFYPPLPVQTQPQGGFYPALPAQEDPNGAVPTVTLPTASIDSSVATNTNVIQAITTTQINPTGGPNPNPQPGDPGYVGFQGDFTFDSTVITFQSPFTQPSGLTSANWNVSGNILGTGPIKVLRVSAFS